MTWDVQGHYSRLPIQGSRRIRDASESEDNEDSDRAYLGFTLEECLRCDFCGEEISHKDGAWVSWWFDRDTQTTTHVWVTCKTLGDVEGCLASYALGKTGGVMLMDHYASVIAKRPVLAWAFDYRVPIAGVVRVFAYLNAARRIGRNP